MHYKYSSLTAFLNTLRIIVERDSSGKEFHTLEPIKGVDFKPKFEVFFITSLLAPHKFFRLLRTTNKSLIYFGKKTIPKKLTLTLNNL